MSKEVYLGSRVQLYYFYVVTGLFVASGESFRRGIGGRILAPLVLVSLASFAIEQDSHSS